MPDSSDILSRFSLETSKSGSPYKSFWIHQEQTMYKTMIAKTYPTQIPGADKTISDSVWIVHRDSYEQTNFTVTMQEFPRI